jgi:hypothetical protein
MAMTSGGFRVRRRPGDPLTDKQKQVLMFVETYQASNGYPPTLREICKAIEIKNPNGARSHLLALVEKGKLEKIGPERGGKYRRVVPGDCCVSCGQTIPTSGKININGRS